MITWSWLVSALTAVALTTATVLFGVSSAALATAAHHAAVSAAASTGGYPWASATCQTTPLTYNGVQYCPNDNWVYNGGLFDSWGYNYRNCTSWVAWRLSTNNGYTMPHAIGDASAWGSYFTAHGHAPNNKPAPGAIAWKSGGDHVAYVESVSANGSQVTISEYNEGFYPGQPTTGDGLYDTRTVPAGDFEYIHVKDLSPSGTLWGINTSGQAVRYAGNAKWTNQGGPAFKDIAATGSTVAALSTAGAVYTYTGNNTWHMVSGATLADVAVQ